MKPWFLSACPGHAFNLQIAAPGGPGVVLILCCLGWVALGVLGARADDALDIGLAIAAGLSMTAALLAVAMERVAGPPPSVDIAPSPGLGAHASGAHLAARSPSSTVPAGPSRLLRAIGHDLNQPLHALAMYLATLSESALTSSAHAVVADARACVSQLSDALSNVVRLCRLDAAELVPQPASVSVRDLLDEVVARALGGEPAGPRLRVRAVDAQLHTDPFLAGAVVGQLLDNALKFAAGGRVLIGCRRQAGWLRLEVHDTGPGIAPSGYAKLFSEFFRGHPRSGTPGLGLGLAVAQRTAALLGTRVTVRSTPGRGSVFCVAFALAPAPSASSSTAPTAVVLGLGCGSIDAVESVLRRQGIHVVRAPDSRQAVALLADSARAPVLVVCGGRLEGEESGVNAVERIREEFNDDIPAMLIGSRITGPHGERWAQEMGIRLIGDDVTPDALATMLVNVCLPPSSADGGHPD